MNNEKNPREIKYGLIAIDPEQEGEMKDILHFCGYWDEPTQIDVDSLRKELIEDDELSYEQTLLLERLRDHMETPSVSYEFLGDNIILRGPDDQLMTFIDEYNKLVEDDFTDLNIINPIIYKKYKKYKK